MNQCLADPSLKDKEGNDAFSEAKQLAHRNGKMDTFTK